MDEPEPDHGEGDHDVPDGGHRVEPERGSDRREKDDEHWRSAALHGRAQGIALRHRQILDHQSGGDRSQERLELLCAAHLAEDRAHAEQHQRDLPSDVAHVEREQRADEDTERDRAADLPGKAYEDIDGPAVCRLEHHARDLHGA